MDARIQLALALWHLTGETAAVLPVLEEGLEWAARGMVGRWTAIRAAEAAGELGPAATVLIPAIRPLLDDRTQCPAAAQALLRIDPSTYRGPSSGHLAERLIESIAADGDPERAVMAIGELGVDVLPPCVVQDLHRLAVQDRRIIGSGVEDRIVREGEQLRELLRQLLQSVA